VKLRAATELHHAARHVVGSRAVIELHHVARLHCLRAWAVVVLHAVKPLAD